MPQQRLIAWLGWTGAVTLGWLLFSVVGLGQILLAVAVGSALPAAWFQGAGTDQWLTALITVLSWLFLFALGWVAGLMRYLTLRHVWPVTNLYPIIMALAWVGGSLIREQWAALVADTGSQAPIWLGSPNTVWLFSVEVLTLLGVAMVKGETITKNPRWIALGVIGAGLGCAIELLLGQNADGTTMPYGVSLFFGGLATGLVSGLGLILTTPGSQAKRRNRKKR